MQRGNSVIISGAGSRQLGHKVGSEPFFDTVRVDVGDADKVIKQALKADVNLRKLDKSTVTIALDETTTVEDVDTLFSVLNGGKKPDFDTLSLAEKVSIPPPHGTCCFPATCKAQLQTLHSSRIEAPAMIKHEPLYSVIDLPEISGSSLCSLM